MLNQIDLRRLAKIKLDMALLQLRFPIATIARCTCIDKGNISKMLSGKIACSDNFFNRFYAYFNKELEQARVRRTAEEIAALSPSNIHRSDGSWTASEITIHFKPGVKCENPINSCQSAYELIRSLWDQESINFQEQYMALFLNPVGKTIGYRVICTGTMLSTPVDIRLIASLALHTFAASVILSHNHPSGKLEASKADVLTTKKVKKALKLIDVKLLDHLIISESGYLSMAVKGLL